MVQVATSCKVCKRDLEVGERIFVDKKTGEVICDPCDNDQWHADPAGDTYQDSQSRMYTTQYGGV